jgi:hypothetical protein
MLKNKIIKKDTENGGRKERYVYGLTDGQMDERKRTRKDEREREMKKNGRNNERMRRNRLYLQNYNFACYSVWLLTIVYHSWLIHFYIILRRSFNCASFISVN